MLKKIIVPLSLLFTVSASAEECIKLQDNLVYELKPYGFQCFIGDKQTNAVKSTKSNNYEYHLKQNINGEIIYINADKLILTGKTFYLKTLNDAYIIKKGLTYTVADQPDYIEGFIPLENK
ncbi:hypothetical protein MHO82_12495 [Vibrio sp. Of7-15]|uniref:hypothetical protein n=1 Tax=Vibrio sp. Of7-15 TaxID=2724879 RepID=UPI001EF2017E|nr:hypothetical protein [Vibrio sp. Of7-15]MCG7497684.1 hypothetical protein [Vibrio sp. Of7-15]